MQLKVPASFWDDHSDRCPADDPENDMCIEVSRNGNRVTIECNDKQLETLRSDAAFYCHRDGPDECPRYVRDGATRTLAAIAKQTAALRKALAQISLIEQESSTPSHIKIAQAGRIAREALRPTTEEYA